MSQFYDQASLVMVPSGYKDGKLYSQKPLSTSGELAFSRGSDIEATRVNSQGYIEKAKVNLLVQSNTFSNAAWIKYVVTETGGQSGYDGTNDAWSIQKTAAFGNVYQAATSSGVQTFSAYLKAGTFDWVYLRYRKSDLSYDGAYFDLANGVLGNVGSTIAQDIQSIGGGWYKCSITFNATLSQILVYPSNSNNGINDSASGNIYIQDAQINYGLVAQDYQETTTAAVVSGITDNMPRLNYDPANPTCPSLLLEGSRTNYFTQSEYLASYAVNRGAISSNVTTSPEGVVNASELVPTTDNGDHTLQALIDLGNVTNTFSIFAKRNGVDISLTFAGSSSSWTGCIFDLANGIAKTPQNSGSQSICTASIEPYGDDWYKCSITATPYASGTFYVFVSLANNVNGSLSTWGRQSFVGVPSQTAYLYGGDLQRGSYPTSYIPTYGSSATRTDDMVGKSSFPTSILNTTTAHSGFFELKPNAIETNSSQVFGFDNGTYSSYIKIYADLTGRHRLVIASGGASGASAYGVANQYNKFAWSYDGAGNVKLFCNGVASANYSITLAAMTVFGAGEKSFQVNYTSQSFKQILLFNSKLTDAQLAELTTL